MIRLTSFVLLLSAAVPLGCNQIMPASIVSGKSAENPLQGQPLVWSRKSLNVPFEGQKACTMWPIEDELTVSATEAEICVKGRLHRLVPASGPEPKGNAITIMTDGPGKSEILSGASGSVSASPARKVGQCVERDQVKAVWQEPYDGCIPNKDHSGIPWLATTSNYLDIGVERWKFAPAPTAAEPAAKASPTK